MHALSLHSWAFKSELEACSLVKYDSLAWGNVSLVWKKVSVSLEEARSVQIYAFGLYSTPLKSKLEAYVGGNFVPR